MWIKKRLNEQGLSLVELLVTLSLISIVLVVAYSYYFFGTRTYAAGENQSNLQQSIRLATDYITREIRFAHLVEVKGSGFTIPASDPNYSYIFIDTATGRISHLKKATTTRLDILSGLSENIAYTMNFRPKSGGSNRLVYSLVGAYKGQNYSLSSELFLENVGSITTADGATVAAGGPILRYATPGPPQPTIKNVTLTPAEKLVTDNVEIAINVQTIFIPNGASVNAKFFFGDPSVITPYEAMPGTVFNNAANLYIPASVTNSLSAGAYKIEVWATGATYPHTKAFVIYNP